MPSTATTDLHQASGFARRRALERLREGLFDPLAVRLLTAHRQELESRLHQDWQGLERGEAVHLCVCGSYGQGKSHTLAYIQQHALQQGFAVSAINLDPRELPWHLVRQVYRALLTSLRLPGREHSPASPETLVQAWSAWARQQPQHGDDPSAMLAALLPEAMPHVFKAILVALAQSTVPIPPSRRAAAQYRDYRPAVFPWTLRRALYGETVALAQLRAACKYRQVSFYRQASLALGSDEPFVRMLFTLPQLLRRLGYRGWVLLFDEAEAMAQVRRPSRARSYRLLQRFVSPEAAWPGLYPVFAFTPDFFQRVQAEDFSAAPFDQDYDRAWRHLAVYHLRGLSAAQWQALCQQLIALHAAAYNWPADADRLQPRLVARLSSLHMQEPRAVLKALVDELDQEQQQHFFAGSAG